MEEGLEELMKKIETLCKADMPSMLKKDIYTKKEVVELLSHVFAEYSGRLVKELLKRY